MNDNTLLQEIDVLAKQFRAAIEACGSTLVLVTLRDFPRGSCGDAALLLAKHLKNHGTWPLTYVRGEMTTARRGIQSHAWLEIEEIIIDITADQFDGISQQVIVTRDRSWYELFEVTSKDEADYNRWSGPGIDSLPRAFQIISSKLSGI